MTTVRRRVLLVGTAVALSGCGVLRTELDEKRGAPVDFGEIASAVPAAVPRVVEVADLRRWVDGFSHALGLRLVTDSDEPFTVDELDGVVAAIWQAVPWEISTLELLAAADLRAAAGELAPVGVRPAGQHGVRLFDLDARYGAWVSP